MPRKAHLLLIDDDPNTLASLARAFRLAGHEATVCDNASRAADLIREGHFDLILSDVVMPGKSGLELLEELKNAGVQIPIVLISGQANIEMAVKATRLGALDFLEKPLTTDKLLVTVENALRLTRLEDENRELRGRLGKHELVGTGPAMNKLLAQIDRVAASETRVCILGETGTGKELVARAIHEKSPRRENAFITLNCAAVPAELIESELFGHEKGAFTGAGGAASRQVRTSRKRHIVSGRNWRHACRDAGQASARTGRRRSGARRGRQVDKGKCPRDRRHSSQSGRAHQEK